MDAASVLIAVVFWTAASLWAAAFLYLVAHYVLAMQWRLLLRLLQYLPVWCSAIASVVAPAFIAFYLTESQSLLDGVMVASIVLGYVLIYISWSLVLGLVRDEASSTSKDIAGGKRNAA